MDITVSDNVTVTDIPRYYDDEVSTLEFVSLFLPNNDPGPTSSLSVSDSVSLSDIPHYYPDRVDVMESVGMLFETEPDPPPLDPAPSVSDTVVLTDIPHYYEDGVDVMENVGVETVALQDLSVSLDSTDPASWVYGVEIV